MPRLLIDRPIVFLDLETTGKFPPTDRIVEICAIKLTPGVDAPEIRTRRVNPGCPIPAESTEIHGIRDEDVADEPEFHRMARSLAGFLEGCDLAGFNIIQFDLPLLRKEFQRAEVPFSLEGRRLLDVYQLFKILEPRSLSAAVMKYLDVEHTDAHGAEADAMATFQVLEGMLERYPDLPGDLSSLNNLINAPDPANVDPEGKLKKTGTHVVLGFGKHRGVSLEELARNNPDYLEWILRGNFSETVKDRVQEALSERQR